PIGPSRHFYDRMSTKGRLNVRKRNGSDLSCSSQSCWNRRPASLGRISEAVVVLDSLLSGQVVEVFGILCLTTKHGFQGYYEVSRGSLDTTPVHPRDVFKAAIVANAAAVIL